MNKYCNAVISSVSDKFVIPSKLVYFVIRNKTIRKIKIDCKSFKGFDLPERGDTVQLERTKSNGKVKILITKVIKKFK